MKKISYALILSAILSATFLVLGAIEVTANGKPIKVILTYLPALSNWGPADATGVAEVVMKEGEVGIDVVGLPPLSEEAYSGWIINSNDNKALRLGHFNTDSSKTAKVRAVLPSEIPDNGWNLVLITVEPKGQANSLPGDRKSIGGYFPDANAELRGPSQLPRTGGDTMLSSSNNGSNNSVTTPATIITPSDNTSGPANNWLIYVVGLIAVSGSGVLVRKSLRRQ
jgi:hypothetical protein